MTNTGTGRGNSSTSNQSLHTKWSFLTRKRIRQRFLRRARLRRSPNLRMSKTKYQFLELLPKPRFKPVLTSKERSAVFLTWQRIVNRTLMTTQLSSRRQTSTFPRRWKTLTKNFSLPHLPLRFLWLVSRPTANINLTIRVQIFCTRAIPSHLSRE